MKSHHQPFFLSVVAFAVAGGCTTPSTVPAPAALPESSSTGPAPVPTQSQTPPVGGNEAVPSGAGSPAESRPMPSRAPVAVGGTCGTIAGIVCQNDLYCAFTPEARCGAGDTTGTCQARPQACTFEYAPVCGCDGKTYSNACAAATAGISVAKKGECQGGSSSSPPARSPTPSTVIGEGQLCGTRGVSGSCADGFYCAYRNRCGEDDSGGLCAKKTRMCTKIYKPVCGCDGKTYGNACTAAGAGVSVASQGACPEPP